MQLAPPESADSAASLAEIAEVNLFSIAVHPPGGLIGVYNDVRRFTVIVVPSV